MRLWEAASGALHSFAAALRHTAEVSRSDTISYSTGKGLASIRDLVLIFTVLSFYIGWSYAENYYEHFNVELRTLNIPIQQFYIYSLRVVQYVLTDITYSLLVVLVATAAYTLRQRFALLAAMLVVAFFWFGEYASRDAALAAIDRAKMGGARVIQFHYKGESALAAANVIRNGREQARESCADILEQYVYALCRGNIDRRFLLIAKTSEEYIIYYLPQSQPGVAAPPLGSVYHVPAEEVAAAVSVMPWRR